MGMNRAVEYFLEEASLESICYLILRVVQVAPEVYERNKEYHQQQKKLPNPYELAKYGARILTWLEAGETRVSLEQLQQEVDPYEVIIFQKFCGRFEYQDTKEGFVPKYVEAKGTRIMQKIWDTREPTRIERAWEKAIEFLWDPSGEEPVLICWDSGE